MLIECQIADTSHRDLEEVEPALLPGSLLVLKREPGNVQLGASARPTAPAGLHTARHATGRLKLYAQRALKSEPGVAS
jgi:hypothetical protein